jgi:hypothetical protein
LILRIERLFSNYLMVTANRLTYQDRQQKRYSCLTLALLSVIRYRSARMHPPSAGDVYGLCEYQPARR